MGLPEKLVDTLVPPRTPGGQPIDRRYPISTTLVEVQTLIARCLIVHATAASLGTYHPFPGVVYIPLRGG